MQGIIFQLRLWCNQLLNGMYLLKKEYIFSCINFPTLLKGAEPLTRILKQFLCLKNDEKEKRAHASFSVTQFFQDSKIKNSRKTRI